MMNRHRILLGLPLAVAAVVAGYLAYRATPTPSEQSEREPAAVVQPAPAVRTSEAAKKSPVLDIGPVSVRGWEGTGLDGDLKLDPRGHVLIDMALRRRFDYVISARGVLSEAQMTNRLLLQARGLGFTETQQAELQQVFESYLRYLAALGNISVDPSSLGSVRTANQVRQQVRRATLGAATAEAFFGQDEAEENYALARMELFQDKSLTSAQRDARLEALLNDLPPQLRAAERDSRTLERVEAKVQSLGSNADPSQIYAARAEVVGAEAAQRLAALDAEDAAWNSRMQALDTERRRIVADSKLTTADQQRMLDSYISREFSQSDAIRARAHLSIASQTSEKR